MDKSFELFEIDHQDGCISIALRRDLAELIAQGLRDQFSDNPCIYALVMQILNANDVLIGQRKLGDVRGLEDVEVVGHPPSQALPMVTRPVLVRAVRPERVRRVYPPIR